MLSTPYRWVNGDSERLNNLPKFSYLVISGGKIEIQDFWLRTHVMNDYNLDNWLFWGRKEEKSKLTELEKSYAINRNWGINQMFHFSESWPVQAWFQATWFALISKECTQGSGLAESTERQRERISQGLTIFLPVLINGMYFIFMPAKKEVV